MGILTDTLIAFTRSAPSRLIDAAAAFPEWMTRSRWDWAVWGWHHPWTLAITPTLIAVLYFAAKLRNR